jgi:hypothetical protein
VVEGICTRSHALHCGHAIGQDISLPSVENSDNKQMKGKEKRPLQGVKELANILGDCCTLWGYNNRLTRDDLGRYRLTGNNEQIGQCTQNTTLVY